MQKYQLKCHLHHAIVIKNYDKLFLLFRTVHNVCDKILSCVNLQLHRSVYYISFHLWQVYQNISMHMFNSLPIRTMTIICVS